MKSRQQKLSDIQDDLKDSLECLETSHQSIQKYQETHKDVFAQDKILLGQACFDRMKRSFEDILNCENESLLTKEMLDGAMAAMTSYLHEFLFEPGVLEGVKIPDDLERSFSKFGIHKAKGEITTASYVLDDLVRFISPKKLENKPSSEAFEAMFEALTKIPHTEPGETANSFARGELGIHFEPDEKSYKKMVELVKNNFRPIDPAYILLLSVIKAGAERDGVSIPEKPGRSHH